jgi:hypothetical protein
MGKFMANALLLTALIVPVVSFWLLKSRFRLGSLIAAAISVAVGWALNVAWASLANESVAIAAAYGWFCPTALVAITWLVLRFAKRRAA